MNIVRYTHDQGHSWNSLVKSSRNGTFLHLREYMDYHADRFTDHSLLVYDDKLVAVLPANECGDTVVTHGGLTYGGLIYPLGVHAVDVLEIFQKIGAYFKAAGKRALVYKATPHIFHRYPAEEDLYALFRHGARLVRRDISSVIELEERPKFSDSRKNTARKADKLGVAIGRSDDFHGFHHLLSSVLAKFGTSPVHTSEELSLLKSRFPDQIELYAATHEGALLAATLVYDFGNVVHTQYMASSDIGRKCGALDFLLLQLIEKTYSNKCYFSFGISTEEQGRILNGGLIRQKEGFGGRAVVHDFYEWNL